MKLRIIILLFASMLMKLAQAQAPKEYIILGPVSVDSLMHDTASKWFSQPAPYTLCEGFTGKLQPVADKLFVKVYAGNWCEDTQRELPRFVKLANATGIKYSLYFVDRDKHSPLGEERKDSILFIPTFILVKDGKEIGRVVESAPYGIEKHLADLLKK